MLTKLASIILRTIDLNADGKLNSADAVVLQKYVLGLADSGLKDTSAADMNNNGRINIADLCMIKAEIVK